MDAASQMRSVGNREGLNFLIMANEYLISGAEEVVECVKKKKAAICVSFLHLIP